MAKKEKTLDELIEKFLAQFEPKKSFRVRDIQTTEFFNSDDVIPQREFGFKF